MFDVGFSELVLLFVIGLLILGPERLPRVAAQLGRWMGKARRTAHQLRMQIEREMTMNDIMREQKKRQEDEAAASSSSAEEQTEESPYPEEEDANESGHADADPASGQIGADDADVAGTETADADAAPGPAKDDKAKEKSLA
jgi:sec-independent protein translocase protein TatB